MSSPYKVLQSTLLVVCALFGLERSEAKDFHVFFLAGQSNMEGYGDVADLSGELARPNPRVWMFHGNRARDGVEADGRGIWAPLQPGHGAGFVSDGESNRYGERFGPELSFAARMEQLRPDWNIALIKYAAGGTSIHPETESAEKRGCWIPEWTGGEGDGAGVNQYDHAVATLNNARAVTDIDGDGEDDRLIPAGIIWMQGESDSNSVESAAAYLGNLTVLMQRLRERFGDADVPVVIGRITDWPVWQHAEQIRNAQESYVLRDARAAIVRSTDGYGNSDRHHYDSEGYIDLGRRFADAWNDLPAFDR